MKLNFEKNLDHQSQAVESTLSVFDDFYPHKNTTIYGQFVNPSLDYASRTNKLYKNTEKLRKLNDITEKTDSRSNIIDIMMETGTGKTYTYTKTIFELNKKLGIFKFIIIVPTLSIKAGTIDFLTSDESREHFNDLYGKSINLHIVESSKTSKSKKQTMPPAVVSFVSSSDFDKSIIQVMIINSGMLNSESLINEFDNTLLDQFYKPIEAISYTKPLVILDEPHKFQTTGKTWEIIKRLGFQFMFRYGATFPEYEEKNKDYNGKIEKRIVKDYKNLIFKLTAVDAFNKNLVKGIIGHITEFKNDVVATVRLINTDGKEAEFELNEDNKIQQFIVGKNGSLGVIHNQISDLTIENLNKSVVILSNGMELKKNETFNPFSFAISLQEIMLRKAIKHHFELEKHLLSQEVKIKPLTLFFIDNIEDYRNANGKTRIKLEEFIKYEVENLLKNEENKFYREYLEKTLIDISKTHGGYFSKDNSGKDEEIEKEINEILHDKKLLLSLDNPRRFIFSKWTLKEGWDNPNVFQICKLRSSGSEISKLQEVGRGLRLPVNEYGNRVKSDDFYLNYFVDFTESDFIEKLVGEINDKSGAVSQDEIPAKLSENMIKLIINNYDFKDENALLQKLTCDDKVIDFARNFLDGGYDYIKENYPAAFNGVSSNKIKLYEDKKSKVSIRFEKYNELKELWEKLNEKVILEYKIKNEEEFQSLFEIFIQNLSKKLNISGFKEKELKIQVNEKFANVLELDTTFDTDFEPIKTLDYTDFLYLLAKTLNVNLKSLHNTFINTNVEINKYLNHNTINIINRGFKTFLLDNSFNKFSIEYQNISNSLHPTSLTNTKGEPLKEINSSVIGSYLSNGEVSNSYYFNELYYDSELEKENIQKNLSSILVFTKIPKNSIKIPVAGGFSYSPDFAYVLNYKDGEQKFYFIVETKNKIEEELNTNEAQKIKHAEALFKDKIKIKFVKQFKSEDIINIITSIRNTAQ